MVLSELNSGDSVIRFMFISILFVTILYFVMVFLGCNIPSFRAELFEDV